MTKQENFLINLINSSIIALLRIGDKQNHAMTSVTYFDFLNI